MENTKTLQQVLNEYTEQLDFLKNYNEQNATMKDSLKYQKVLSEYLENATFLSQIKDYLDITQHSTFVNVNLHSTFSNINLQPNNTKTFELKTRSFLDSREEYIDSMAKFTGGFDNKFVKTLYEINSDHIKDCSESAIKFPLSSHMVYLPKFLQEKYGDIYDNPKNNLTDKLTVEDIKSQMKVMDKYIEKYNIDMTKNIPEQVIDIYAELNNQRELNVFETKTIEYNYERIKTSEKEKQQQEKEEYEQPTEIVESNDGYVLNHSKFTSNNFKELDAKIDDNTVHNTIVKATSNDMSNVGGNIKYEAANDYGSIEQEDIENGYDVDYQTSESYYNSKNSDTPEVTEDKGEKKELKKECPLSIEMD